MKKLIFVICGALVLAIFANCGRNDQPVAAAGMPATCYYQQTSNGAGGFNNYYGGGYPGGLCNYNYSALAGSGFTQAQVGYGGFNYTSGFMGGICGASQAVVYSATKGLGCVDATRLNLSGQVATYTLNQQTQTFVPSSAPSPYYQYQNQYPNNMYGYNNGFNNMGGSMMNGMLTVLRVCEGAEPCPAGQSCRSPIGPAGASGVGVCYF